MNGDFISREELLGTERLLMTDIVENDKVARFVLEQVLFDIGQAPAVDAVDRAKLLKRLFPLGIPRTREDWNYSINARAVYEAIMKE